jgi:hypothetical protein
LGYALKKGAVLLATCEKCGFSYVETIPSDVRVHNKRHSLWQEACDLHGFEIMNYIKREKVKRDFYSAYRSLETSHEEKLEKSVLYFKTYFSRSLESSGYSPKHPDFKQYVSHMLAGKHYRESLAEIYDDLCKEYPPVASPHLLDGYTVYKVK